MKLTHVVIIETHSSLGTAAYNFPDEESARKFYNDRLSDFKEVHLCQCLEGKSPIDDPEDHHEI